MSEIERNDSLDAMRKGISLMSACIEDMQNQLFALMASQEKPRRRRFAGTGNVIDLSERKRAGGAR